MKIWKTKISVLAGISLGFAALIWGLSLAVPKRGMSEYDSDKFIEKEKLEAAKSNEARQLIEKYKINTIILNAAKEGERT